MIVEFASITDPTQRWINHHRIIEVRPVFTEAEQPNGSYIYIESGNGATERLHVAETPREVKARLVAGGAR